MLAAVLAAVLGGLFGWLGRRPRWLPRCCSMYTSALAGPLEHSEGFDHALDGALVRGA